MESGVTSGASIGIISNNNADINSALISAMTNTLYTEYMQLIGQFKQVFPEGEMELDVDAIGIEKWKTQNYASILLKADSIEIKRLENKISSHFDYVNIQDYDSFVSAMYLWLKDSQNAKRVFIVSDEYLGSSHKFSFIVDTLSKRHLVSMRWQID